MEAKEEEEEGKKEKRFARKREIFKKNQKCKLHSLTLTKNQFNHLHTIASNSTFSINPQHLEFMVTIYYTKRNMIQDI